MCFCQLSCSVGIWCHHTGGTPLLNCKSKSNFTLCTITDINYHYFIVTNLFLRYTIWHPCNEVITSSMEELSATDVCQMQQRITSSLHNIFCTISSKNLHVCVFTLSTIPHQTRCTQYCEHITILTILFNIAELKWIFNKCMWYCFIWNVLEH